ncbi:hypothetical protein [Streptomyces xinghaiensis]|uniref:hypothetical protein n=1 Tax=Streptomyces xinghaiensis TaxID=1038928 RepID=UPI000584DEAB|nr:hypothetical protein [Streptomyces xinghaiensis]MZE75530.1 hypothetical protein [Streptomyces sp. SID5475]
MRKIPAVLATLTLAGLGATAPATTAQAAATATCSDNYTAAKAGYMYAYKHAYCEGHIGNSASWDSNWGNSSGPFQGGDTNVASSILNKGNSYEVQFFNGTGQDWAGGHICLSRNEAYASNLNNDEFHNNIDKEGGANDAISSHRWVAPGSNNCDRWAT